MRDICDAVARGEQKKHVELKKEMVEANLRLVISIAKKIHKSRFTILRFNSRREYRFNESGR